MSSTRISGEHILSMSMQVAGKSTHVSINKSAIREFCKNFDSQPMRHWLDCSPANFDMNQKQKANFVFVLDSISFCYWGNPKWELVKDGKLLGGAYSMVYALQKAIDYGYPILDAKYFSKIPGDDFVAILKADAKIPLFERRLRILRNNGKRLNENYGGEAINLAKKSISTINCLNEIVSAFPSFNDISHYGKLSVPFFKRAQLLAADLSHFLSMEGVRRLTACADYKVPKVLRHLGILKYDDILESDVDSKALIEKGSEKEIEIRANTIYSVFLITKGLGREFTQNQINDYLWLYGQDEKFRSIPEHRTLTTSY